MPPYDYQFAPSSDQYYENPPASYYAHQSNHYCADDYSNRDAIISSLVEKLADREAEIRKLSTENSALENKLKRSKETIKQETTKFEELENEYEKLMERLSEREEELRLVLQRNDELLYSQQELEMACSKLQHGVDVREEELSVMKNELEVVRGHLTHAIDAQSYNTHRDICSLENKVDDLQKELEYYKLKAQEADTLNYHLSNREIELKSILKENNEMLEEQEKEISVLAKKNRRLESEGEVQRSMLEEQEQDITNMKRMLVKLNDVIKSQDVDLDKRENTILQLSLDIERYEDIVEEAEHVTWEQHQKIKAETQSIEKMSTEIEQLKDELKWERAGVMSFYGCGNKGCGAKV